jgi:hypothetical protein
MFKLPSLFYHNDKAVKSRNNTYSLFWFVIAAFFTTMIICVMAANRLSRNIPCYGEHFTSPSDWSFMEETCSFNVVSVK